MLKSGLQPPVLFQVFIPTYKGRLIALLLIRAFV